MERKIGEIFEYNGEWYQVVKSNGECCKGCAFYEKGCKAKYADVGSCGTSREDWTQVIFKKLEKVGEPIEFARGLYFQRYQLADSTAFYEGDTRLFFNAPTNTFVYIEIKTKEDMEDNKLNLKPFDIQKAREGKPVCTRDGRKARIICFDRISGDDYEIVACVTTFDGDFEEVLFYGIDGYIVDSQNPKDADLMMLPEKKEGYAVIFKDNLLRTEKEARELAELSISEVIRIEKIEWEE